MQDACHRHHNDFECVGPLEASPASGHQGHIALLPGALVRILALQLPAGAFFLREVQACPSAYASLFFLCRDPAFGCYQSLLRATTCTCAIMMPPSCHHHATMPAPCHHAIMPPCHHATMPSCHHATMPPPCHHATMPSCPFTFQYNPIRLSHINLVQGISKLSQKFCRGGPNPSTPSLYFCYDSIVSGM